MTFFIYRWDARHGRYVKAKEINLSSPPLLSRHLLARHRLFAIQRQPLTECLGAGGDFGGIDFSKLGQQGMPGEEGDEDDEGDEDEDMPALEGEEDEEDEEEDEEPEKKA